MELFVENGSHVCWLNKKKDSTPVRMKNTNRPVGITDTDWERVCKVSDRNADLLGFVAGDYISDHSYYTVRYGSISDYSGEFTGIIGENTYSVSGYGSRGTPETLYSEGGFNISNPDDPEWMKRVPPNEWTCTSSGVCYITRPKDFYLGYGYDDDVEKVANFGIIP
jgi:hypothetical protein